MRAERSKASAVVKGELATPLPRAVEQTVALGQACELNIEAGFMDIFLTVWKLLNLTLILINLRLFFKK